MKAIHFFYTGLVIDALILALYISNFFMMKNLDIDNSLDGFSSTGLILLWLVPFLLIALIGAAFWLKKAGKMLPANVLLWIPALPMLASIVVMGGLAVLFILFGK